MPEKETTAMPSTGGAEKSAGYGERWKRVMEAMRSAGRRDADAQRLAWLLWASHVLADVHHLKRKPAFPPPEDLEDWVKVRQLVTRARRRRAKLKTEEQTQLLNSSDYLEQLRLIETENAATLECLLHAAWLLWDANGNVPNAGAETIYDHVLSAWGIMPPPIESLSTVRPEVYRMCLRFMRESDLVPTWYYHGLPIPRELRTDVGPPPDGVEQTPVPSSSELFGGVDP